MGKTIMTVDDSTSVRQMVAFTLKGAGYNVIQAVDGRDAIAKSNGAGVNMVITDLNMPNMDGQTLLQHIKSSPLMTDLPVLVISSASNKAVETQLMAKGALAVLNKPVTPAGIAHALASLTEDEEDFGWG